MVVTLSWDSSTSLSNKGQVDCKVFMLACKWKIKVYWYTYLAGLKRPDRKVRRCVMSMVHSNRRRHCSFPYGRSWSAYVRLGTAYHREPWRHLIQNSFWLCQVYKWNDHAILTLHDMACIYYIENGIIFLRQVYFTLISWRDRKHSTECCFPFTQKRIYPMVFWASRQYRNQLQPYHV